MSALWTDLGNTLARAGSNPVLTFPFDGVAVPYVLTQRFQQPYANFSPLPLNTAHPDDATYLLTREYDFEDAGGGQQRWTREYCKVPDQRYESSSYSYLIIGMTGYIVTSNDPLDSTIVTHPGRFRKTVVLPAKLQFDYYLLDGVTLVTPSDIPLINATVYKMSDDFTDTDFVFDSPPALFGASIPSRTTYEGYITADKPVSQGGVDSFSLVAEASRLQRWHGNIFERATLYLKAE